MGDAGGVHSIIQAEPASRSRTDRTRIGRAGLTQVLGGIVEGSENADGHQYNWVMFRTQTIQFVIRAIDFYLSLLGDEEKNEERGQVHLSKQ